MATDSTPPKPTGPKLSPVEGIKDQSRYLRGELAEELAQTSDHFQETEKQLLKFHGSYQQEDRDARKARKKEGASKHYMFMVRTRQPGGKMTAAQYLAIDQIAGDYANGTIRFTTRQGIQLHGILKGDLKNTIAGINDCLLTTLGACGDVNRNVMACPAPLADPVRQQMQQLADQIAEHLAPRSKAYHEIWLNGERVDGLDEEFEPIYGKVYLPRKFKIGLTRPDDNCIDIYAQDLGFVAILDQGAAVGYNILVGGGMGRTHGKAETFAHLGQPICFVTPDQVIATAEAVVKLYRDHGNRENRKRARIKYLVADWGVEKFREVLKNYLPVPLELPRAFAITHMDLHHGWHAQGDGKWFLGLSVENGRIKDAGELRLRAGLRAIAERYQTPMRITAQQDVILCDIDPANKAGIDSLLNEYGIPRPENLSLVQRYSMACPAIPTCGLAISESERALPAMIDELEAELNNLGLGDQAISVRMTGCPNGCARPYQSDIGIVGRSGDKYTLYLGGSTLGTRLNYELQDLVPRDQILPMLRTLLTHFKASRQGEESFGDFCHRLGQQEVRELIGLNGTGH